MKIGIVPNTSKVDIISALDILIKQLQFKNIEYAISDTLKSLSSQFTDAVASSQFTTNEKLAEGSDVLISLGGDGTMLHTAYEFRNYSIPIFGVNIGKLGFLAEFDLESLGMFLDELIQNNYQVEERIALVAEYSEDSSEKLFAINDIVVDKGPWPKMIDITIQVDDDYVATFAADGIIIATPTGSTGYSLSAGGPIINPKAQAVTLSPIAPHTLTMRPLIISNDQTITVMVNCPSDKIQVSCDGQRVKYLKPPAKIKISKSGNAVKLIHSSRFNYFETLRSKLYWGLDIRNMKTGRS